jgi:cytochrome c oxidase cbb3-type subunit I/II
MSSPIETFRYDDRISRMFLLATVIWGFVGMLAGVLIALLLFVPEANFAPWLTFGRLRPVHTNAVIFAFAGNIIFTGVYYSTQRLCKARMFSDTLSWIHFWGWQIIIVGAAVTLPLGFTQGKEYAELEWPLDILIAAVWVVFGVNFMMTLVKRREKHLYTALWFYIASIVTVAFLHIFNNLSSPHSILGSFSIYAGVQDSLMQWWYGHNAVAFVLTTPFLGLMYYFLPKAANRPVFSYTMSILHFWGLIFVYIWAGPHHLHYTALPVWASTLGMVFSVILWAPSWGGMLNGLLTLRGAWHKLRNDPVLQFLVVGVTYYGMSTFEGPMMSIKSVNVLSHYTDWTIGHVHAGALGWNAFIAFGVIYWLLPRLWKTELWSRKLAVAHFWIGTIGLLLYQVSMWVAGITQGLMWRAFEPDGRLTYPDFIETVTRLIPMYQIRFIGGLFFLAGVVLLVVNLIATIRNAGEGYAEEPELSAPALERARKVPGAEGLAPTTYDHALYRVQDAIRHGVHRALEAMPLTLTVLSVLAISVGSLVELVPLFLLKSVAPTIRSVQPLTPLELAGRGIYIREGCYTCHSQMIRPFKEEVERYGEYSKPGEFVYDHPFQWGSKRTGPDLQREGTTGRSDLWHVRHMEAPAVVTQDSIMPAYTHLLEDETDYAGLPAQMRALRRVGVPYGDSDIEHAQDSARAQAAEFAARVEADEGPPGLADKEIMALTAYLQRLGTDIAWEEPSTDPAAGLEVGP